MPDVNLTAAEMAEQVALSEAILAELVAEEAAGRVTVTLRIENTYELYDEVITTPTVTIPAPPPEDDEDAYSEWAQEYIQAETGVGHDDGDSWYDVLVTASTDPELVGRTFEFGDY
jgi:hypothetical protein